MKRIISLLLAGLMLLSFVGCESKPKPEDTVSNFLEALKTNNKEELDKHPFCAEEASIMNDFLTEEEESFISKESVLSLFSDIKYKIHDTEISEDGKTAIVSVSVTNSDFGEVMKKFIIDMNLMSSSEVSEKNAEENIRNALDKRIKEAKEKEPKAIETTVELTKKDDDTWEINKNGNVDFINAFTGNIIKSSDELSESFKK